MRSMWHVRLALLLLAMICSMPAAAQDLAAEATTQERALLPEIRQAIATADLGAMDALLRQLPAPTRLRGILQAARSDALLRVKREAEAKAAAEESVRLTPGLAATRLQAAYVLVFAGAPMRAADLWLEGAMLDPVATRASPSYLVALLVSRLNEIGQRALADKVSARADEIGYLDATPEARSASAAARLRTTFRQSGAEAARPLVAAITNPSDLSALFVNAEFAALWPTIAQWAGPDFEPATRRYLEELRSEWRARRELVSATAYARMLNALGAHDAVVALFLPELRSADHADEPADRALLAPVVSSALVAIGRPDEARAVLTEAASGFPEELAGMGLNLSAAQMTVEMLTGDWNAAVRRADSWQNEARALSGEINRTAVLQVASRRRCALDQSGRGGDAALSEAEVATLRTVAPGALLNIHLCRGDLAAARATLLAALTDPDHRSFALVLVQPDIPPPSAFRYLTIIHAGLEKLRRDPVVLAAVRSHGRVLDKPVPAGLPRDFDPRAIEPAPPPSPDSI